MTADATAQHADSRLGVEKQYKPPLRDRIGDWIFPPKGPEAAPVTLSQRRVYILPTGAGLLFGATLVLMLIGSINYSLSLGYGLTFLLTGTGLVSMLHTWRNLAKLQLRPGKTEPVFAGENARFGVVAINPGRLQRPSLAIRFLDQQPTYFNIDAGGHSTVRVPLKAPARGIFRPGRFRIFTTYPLGLFYAWANVQLDLSCLVYPAPEVGDVAPPEAQEIDGPGSATGQGEEDFAGLRNYHQGDSLRLIAWKAMARNDVLATKLFSGTGHWQLWLDYASTPSSMSTEQRLSRLTRWVLEASEAGLRYGVRLPGREIERNAGEAHRARCLEALAKFGLTEQS